MTKRGRPAKRGVKVKFDRDKKTRFVRLIKNMECNLVQAAEACGVSYNTYLLHYKNDADFRQAVEEAKEEKLARKLSMIEDEIFRRGVEGWDEPIYQGGALVGHKRVYSDALLRMEAKALSPDKYGDKQVVEHKGTVTHEVMLEAKESLIKKFKQITKKDNTLGEPKGETIDVTPLSVPLPVKSEG